MAQPDPRRLTEAEENTLRVLLPKIRDTEPALFITMMFDAAINKMTEDKILGFRRIGETGQLEAMLILFHGPEAAKAAEDMIVDARRRLEADGKDPESEN